MRVRKSSVPSHTLEAEYPGLKKRFSQTLVMWQKKHGRNTLPWQNTQDPYRVWLSEIMLQQTQVTTVLDYYAKFLQRFPTVSDLAVAQTDEVMALWSGLGYYSRARNMHRCAQQVMALHEGQFPNNAAQLQTLPGIGPSTAAAIASFCFAERAAILDGNVKRVLTRVLAFSGDLAQSSQERQLLSIANILLPEQDLKNQMPRYTQALMDLGATVCTPRRPQCAVCPVQDLCQGFAGDAAEKYPVKTKKLKRSAQTLALLWAQRPDGSVWLERRPASGIWGGLYCLPVFESQDALIAFVPKHLHARMESLAPLKHVLTHKDLYLYPVMTGFSVMDGMPQRVTATSPAPAGAWFALDVWPNLGLPAPIRKLLQRDTA